MKQKLFTLLTLLCLCVTSAWAQTTIFHIQLDCSGSPALNTALTGNGGTVTPKVTSGSTGFGNENPKTYANDFPNDMKALGTKAIKSGNDTQYWQITLSSGNFQAGDVLYVGGYGSSEEAVVKVSSTSELSADISSTFSLGTNANTKVYSLELPEEITYGNSLFIQRKGKTYGVTAFKVVRPETDERDNLSLSFTPDNSNIAVDGTLTTSFSILSDISGESSKYSAVSYSSDNTSVATVNSSGVVTGIAEGTTTIKAKITAESDAVYKTTTVSITVNVATAITKNASIVTPTAILDLSDADAASAILNNGTWLQDVALYGSNEDNNYLTFTVYSGYQSRATQTWSGVSTDNGSHYGASTDATWNATGVFKGSNAYNVHKAATSRVGDRPYTYYSYRVKGATKVQALVKSVNTSLNVILAAFEITNGTPANSTLLYGKDKSGQNKTISVNLDKTSSYLITVYAEGSSNSSLYEMALFYDKDVQLYETIAAGSGKTWGTYVTTTDIDLSTVSTNISAYRVPGLNSGGTAVELEDITEIPAGSPILFQTSSAGGSVNVPVATTTPAALGTNCMVKGTGSAVVAGTGTTSRYVLSNGKFKLIGTTSPTVSAKKAYLEITSSGEAHEFLFLGEGEATGIANLNINDNASFDADAPMYNLAGQRVSKSYKGVVIQNGKKMLNK